MALSIHSYVDHPMCLSTKILTGALKMQDQKINDLKMGDRKIEDQRSEMITLFNQQQL